MKKLKFVLAVSISLLFSGCANNQSSTKQFVFNPNNKGIAFVEGKPYRVPYGSRYATQTDKVLLANRKRGLDCRSGDVLWLSTDAIVAIQNVKRKKDPNLTNSVDRMIRERGLIGCAHPLSNTEYQYYMEQRRQQISNARYKQQQEQYQRQQEQQAYDNTMASLNQQTANMASYINSQNNSGNYYQKTNNLQHTWLRDTNGNMHSLYSY